METLPVVGFVASIIMGLVLGLMGGGGSILTVPILVYLFGLAPTAATGSSLFVVGLTAVLGGLIYLKKGEVNFKIGALFAIPSVIGVNLSRGFLVPRLPSVVFESGSILLTKDVLIMVAFAVLMVFASVSMIRKRKPVENARGESSPRSFILVVEGFVVGLIAGFVGAGGGFLIIPALVLFAGLSMRTAVGTSLWIIAFQSLIGFTADVSRGFEVEWKLLGGVAACAAIGIALGSQFSHKLKEASLKVGFGWFVLAMGCVILAEQLLRL